MNPAWPEREFGYAGFWARAAARVIDLLIILAVFNLFFLLSYNFV